MKLVLYKFDSCPYCQLVMRFIRDHEIDVEMKDTLMDSRNREELMSIGGKTQVPCLVIDGKPLYESMDIVNWLEENVLS